MAEEELTPFLLSMMLLSLFVVLEGAGLLFG
jgi:hypothetical protein